ncbi:MAG TPA: MBL fold metallo-hydrolase [Xanthobacteraceae bacterium]|nr:MBL fold metallo-hydrolase [Xanthobacteraceae bacterium]
MRFTRRRVLTSLAALSAMIAGGFGARAAASRYYDGPISDHFDGRTFFDPHGMPPKTVGQVIRWRMTGNRAEWPEHVPNQFSDRPPERVNGARLRISFVGHATLLVQTGGLNILFDPVWSERVSPFSFLGPKRARAPGIAFETLPPIDLVLVSHCHYDHLDLATLSRLAAAHRPRVITPLGNDTIMLAHDPTIRAEAHDWGERVEFGNGMAAVLAPMRHWSARGVFDRNKALWAAFVLETPWGKIYHVGDSGYGDGYHFRTARERHGPFRLAILPFGAYEPRWFMRDQHMNPEDSLRAFKDCEAELALGHHYGTFQLTDEAIDAPLTALAEARRANAVSADRFRTLEPGEVWEL